MDRQTDPLTHSGLTLSKIGSPSLCKQDPVLTNGINCISLLDSVHVTFPLVSSNSHVSEEQNKDDQRGKNAKKDKNTSLVTSHEISQTTVLIQRVL